MIKKAKPDKGMEGGTTSDMFSSQEIEDLFERLDEVASRENQHIERAIEKLGLDKGSLKMNGGLTDRTVDGVKRLCQEIVCADEMVTRAWDMHYEAKGENNPGRCEEGRANRKWIRDLLCWIG